MLRYIHMAQDKPFAVHVFKRKIDQVGQKIKLARQNKGMTQTDLADILDISSKTISAIEVGRVEPSISQMQAISAVLEEPIGYFIGEDASSIESKMEHVKGQLEEITRIMNLVRSRE
jgi:DNA-binding XRE family transcriptional regulator